MLQQFADTRVRYLNRNNLVRGAQSERKMKILRSWVQHHFNSLHLYCRLIDAGIAMETAKRFCRRYEHFAHRVIYSHEENQHI